MLKSNFIHLNNDQMVKDMFLKHENERLKPSHLHWVKWFKLA